MEKKLSDYIRYYIGCKVQKGSDALDYPTIEGIDGDHVVISEYSYKTPDCDNVFTRPRIWHTIAFVKPVLRRLGDMTESQMIGLLQSMAPADMEDKPTPEDYSLEMFYNDDGLMVDSDIAVGANYSCRCYEGQIGVKLCGSIVLFDETGKDVTRNELTNTPFALHYLLQHHFDLFGLIDAGLALDAKTITP
jgi:hypothetical protein